ncbi:MAG: hypothetical protein AAGC67_08395, partial [Myxococcota bacterium]
MIRQLSTALAVLSVAALSASSASAILYGDFSDAAGTVSFNAVEDVNGLYGMPSVSLNSLDFTPTQFEAECLSSCLTNPSPGLDTVDDLLTLEIDANGGQQITEIQISEGLDYNLQAFGPGAIASATVTASVFVDIYEINQVAVTGISDNFTVNFNPSGNFTQFGPAGIESGNFTGELTIDIQSVLALNSVVGEATGVRISFNNTLTAFHSGGGLASIRKRDADFVSLT